MNRGFSFGFSFGFGGVYLQQPRRKRACRVRSRPHFAGISCSLNFNAVPIQARGHFGSGREAFLTKTQLECFVDLTRLTLPML